MTRKVYRTAQGKMVDLGSLQLQNETVRAVGNMGVNARGDIVDSKNSSIASKNRQVAKQYQKQTGTAPAAQSLNTPAVVVPPAPPEDFDDEFEKSIPPTATTGLAGAMSRAKQN
jgi:hypothetical protein